MNCTKRALKMKKENFVENFEKLFGTQYLKRNREYYKEGLVKKT